MEGKGEQLPRRMDLPMGVTLALLVLLGPGAAAAQGWYLVAPPWPAPAWPDNSQPLSIAQLEASAKTTRLSRWDRLGSYATVTECVGDHARRMKEEAELSKRRLVRIDQLTKLGALSPGQKAELEELLAMDVVGDRIGLARCVSAADPGLAP